ncbi:ubiquitin-like domain-containing protein [Streptomyces sp. ID03-2B]|uniref:ubiquitin-like domain-containing protein n=1 Tax=Streptomyces sp. ID03-2B TaxID=3028660 RepID=UPI0029A37C14|nr:ubiquitin-like domain-containing protein [Streptomyces sp. ID03-2B]MDX3593317.1 ubiquitin-like domain-containing protein [Streptomyces sp. ID03-2B]
MSISQDSGVRTAWDGRFGAFHEQLTLADGVGTAGPAHAPPAAHAHAPTVVDTPLGGPPPVVPRQGPTRADARRAAKRRRRLVAGPENLKRLVPKALVVAFLAGGTTAFVAQDKAVRLEVDGTPRTLHTFADDVTELLAEEGVAVGPHDVVAPGAGAALDHGDEVVVRHGRPVTLTLDGVRRQVWTTADTVAGALREFGIRAEGAHLSAARSARIARTGLTLTVRTERTVTFMADGQERTLRTNAATVREALAQAGITLHGHDTTSVDPGRFPRDGQTISVMRITDTHEVREETVPYAVERSEDPALFRGTEVVERAGRNGVRRVTYAVRTVNGVRQKPRRAAEELVHRPVSRVVRTGTRQRPDSVAGADGLNWSALAACESGGRPGAVDPSGTYGGLYQFDTGTWQSLGGSGRPQDAPAAEQTYRAKKLYVQRGASPWPHCGRRLTG